MGTCLFSHYREGGGLKCCCSNDIFLEIGPEFHDSSDSSLFPLAFSTPFTTDGLSDQEILIAEGESCSVDSMSSSTFRRRNLDWLWNLFKTPEKEAPNVCPAPSSPPIEQPVEQQTEAGGEGPLGPIDPSNLCEDYHLLCCRGDYEPEIDGLEQCYSCESNNGCKIAFLADTYVDSIQRKPICNYKKYWWCCWGFGGNVSEKENSLAHSGFDAHIGTWLSGICRYRLLPSLSRCRGTIVIN
jgi:hypothetical protein